MMDWISRGERSWDWFGSKGRREDKSITNWRNGEMTQQQAQNRTRLSWVTAKEGGRHIRRHDRDIYIYCRFERFGQPDKERLREGQESNQRAVWWEEIWAESFTLVTSKRAKRKSKKWGYNKTGLKKKWAGKDMREWGLCWTVRDRQSFSLL